MQAVGTYIRILRESQGMTINDLVLATGLNTTYIWRVESGASGDVGLMRISKIADAVKGRGDHIMALFLCQNASDDYIEQLAREALMSDAERDAAASFFATDEETRALLEAVHEKAANPALRNRIRGYVDSLSAGAPEPSVAPRRTSRRRRDG